jgi:hypothetical protein
MDVSGWLEVVLSWPSRFIAAEPDEAAGLGTGLGIGLDLEELGPAGR